MQAKKIAVITGGSSGIGQVVVEEMAARGYMVVFTYRKQAGADETCRMVQARGGECQAVCCDIADPAATRKLIDDVVAKYGRVDVMINCAGISNTKRIEEIDEVEWDTMMDTNLRGAFFLMQATFAVMKKQRYGRMVSMTSIAGQRGGFFSGVHYSASKGGLETMMKCFALAGAEYGITSNAVSPGTVATPMSKEEGIPADGIPLGRMAEPKEVADAVCFLASDEAGYITGTTLDVNGGQMMR